MNISTTSLFNRIRARKALDVMSLAAALTLPMLGHAQSDYYENQRYDRESYISIYEDCDFRGERRDIAVGEFRNMRALDFGNDKISSIQVPQGLQVTIFEHDDFKGDYAKVDHDVRCFNRSWNDQVSSLRVLSHDRDYGQGDRPVYGGDKGDRPRYGGDNRDDRARQNPKYNDGVTGQNVAKVVFDNTVLQQVSKRTWEINEPRRGVSQYEETQRSNRNVYLQNKYTDERIEIDMQNNTVLVRRARGGEQRFAVTSRNAARGTLSQPSVPRGEPDTYFSNRCIDYFAYTNGKTGSIRFSTEKGVNKFQNRGHRGRICHRGELVIEMGKRDFGTDYTLEVNGRKFKFASGEKETQYRNNWYRKVIKLQVGR